MNKSLLSKLESLTGADRAKLANELEMISHVLHCMFDKCEDEGDRIYFGSTNDHWTLRRQAKRLFAISAALKARREE